MFENPDKMCDKTFPDFGHLYYFVLAILIYSTIAIVFLGLCYLWNVVLYPPKEEMDIEEGGRRNTEKSEETKF